ncbi:hypothetical protein HYH02_010453 [Chlamydomonas schloesseri]|uniref:Mitochondrial ribonuclease P catalytic subunit n=1 Tax=Chlamydomonas schloesseri TaxID=2026947 RepID=A0A835TGC6_9CHLO|nr:hypothetical protein HYH02_010453 [Chlamydomonas schloesseri]|eukprot:KAG2439819.1 hypothetical protein HYH02_010453 [Chlamydomonas schloesseri]
MGSDTEEPQAQPANKRQRTNGGAAATPSGAGPAAQAAEQQQRKGKRGKDAWSGMIGKLHQAVKVNNLPVAMATFRDIRAAGGSLPVSVMNSLLFLACGCEQWERYARGLTPLPPTALPTDARDQEQGQGQGQPAAAAAAAAGAAGAGEGAEGANGAAGSAAAEAEAGGKKGGKGQAQARRKAANAVPPPEGPPPSKEELLAAVDELWGAMQEAGQAPDAGTYLGLARREALKGNPAAALAAAKECAAKTRSVQLRTYHPAMVGFCLAGDAAALEALYEIDALITGPAAAGGAGLDATEYEYARLLEGIAAAGSYGQLRAVLLRMQDDLNQLSPATADLVAAFFERRPQAAAAAFAAPEAGGCPGLAAAAAAAPAAAAPTAAAGEGEAAAVATRSEAAAAGAEASTSGSWQVLRSVAVERGGRCEAAGGSLRVIDLAEAEWESFANAIAGLARTNMGGRAAEFDNFAAWYERHGPYDILVDAANVAYFGQNREGGGFTWAQIQAMYGLLRRRFPTKKILVMLHRNRLKDPEANTPSVQAFLTRLRRRRAFNYTPPGANDDWFWLYACVRAKRRGLLVSNDLLRDHIFSLLRPKHFLKWKQRHIARYTYQHWAQVDPEWDWDAPQDWAETEEEQEEEEQQKQEQGQKEEAKAEAGKEQAAAAKQEEEDGAKEEGKGEEPAEEKGEENDGDGEDGGAGEGDNSLFVLQMPSPYTPCVQQLPESGAWMVPVRDGTWLCIRPQRA